MSTGRFNESVVEDAALTWLDAIGWQIAHGPDIAPGRLFAERGGYSQTVTEKRLLNALLGLDGGPRMADGDSANSVLRAANSGGSDA